MSKTCTVCGENRSRFTLNNKLVCLKCDDLLFDLEIECDAIEAQDESSKTLTDVLAGKPRPVTDVKK